MKKLTRRTIELLAKKEYSWIPSSLSFYFIFSIIPLIFTISLLFLKYFVSQKDTLLKLNTLKPFHPYLADFINYIDTDIANLGIVALSALLLYSTFLSSNGIRGVMYAVNSFFGFERISSIKAIVLSYLVSIILIISLFIIVVFISLVPPLIELFSIKTHFTRSYIFLLPLIYLVVHFIYFMVSGFKLRFADIYKGALFSTLAIYILVVFSSLIFYTSKASLIYGSLAIVFLISHFLLYISYAIYFGIAINVANYQLNHQNKLVH